MKQESEKPSAQSVLENYERVVKQWASEKQDGFSWPDDALCQHEWQYWVHCRWVEDWNATDREKDCVEFLLGWLTEENILRAWQDWDEWEKKGEELLKNLENQNEDTKSSAC